MIQLLKALRPATRYRALATDGSALIYSPKPKKYEHISLYKIGGNFTIHVVNGDGKVIAKMITPSRIEALQYLRDRLY